MDICPPLLLEPSYCVDCAGAIFATDNYCATCGCEIEHTAPQQRLGNTPGAVGLHWLQQLSTLNAWTGVERRRTRMSTATAGVKPAIQHA